MKFRLFIKLYLFLIILIPVANARVPRNIFLSKEYKGLMFQGPVIGIVFPDSNFYIFQPYKDDTTFGKTNKDKNAMDFFKSEVITSIKNLTGCSVVKTGTIRNSYISQIGYISKSYGSFPVEYPANGTVLSLSEEISDVDIVLIISKIGLSNLEKTYQYASPAPTSVNGIEYPQINSYTTSKMFIRSNVVMWDNMTHKLVYYAIFEKESSTPKFFHSLIDGWKNTVYEYCGKIFSKIRITCGTSVKKPEHNHSSINIKSIQ